MNQLNYHHLYYFYVVAKSGSIAAACKILLLAQPTVSMQLKELERSMGRLLFDRKKQRLHLTEEGRLVLDYAESIFEMGRELQDALRDRPERGKMAIQVGLSSGMPRAFGHALLDCIFKGFPTARINAREGLPDEFLRELREQRLDVVLMDVGMRSQDQEEFSNHLVGKIPIVFAASPAIARRYPAFPRGIEDAPFILPSLPSQVSQQVNDLLLRWKSKPKVVAEVQDVELARRLAISGYGIAPLNSYTVSVSMPPKALAILGAGKSFGVYESVYLVARRRKWPNPIAEYLMRKFRLPAQLR